MYVGNVRWVRSSGPHAQTQTGEERKKGEGEEKTQGTDK